MRNISFFFLFLLFAVCNNTNGQNANVPRTANEVIRVDYGAAMMSNKVKGSFIKVGEREWIEKTSEGEFHWQESAHKYGSIFLFDTSRNRFIEMSIGKRQINKAGTYGSSLMYGIKNIEMGKVQTQADLSKNTANVNPPLASNDTSSKSGDMDLNIPDLDKPPVYHAFLIAEGKYNEASYHSLSGTVRDVQKIYELLTSKYTFEPDNMEILISATKESILSKLNNKIKTLGENDNLFIFYAGHGWIKKYENTGREEGFLIPSDAQKGDEVSFINSYDITSIINRCKAKHILFTADACFAGSLFRDIPSEAPMGVKEAYKEKSRRLLSSGNLQAVSDESDFVELLRLSLQENREKYVTAGKLIDRFKEQYMEKTHMQLLYNPIPNVDDQGGEFVFMRR